MKLPTCCRKFWTKSTFQQSWEKKKEKKKLQIWQKTTHTLPKHDDNNNNNKKHVGKKKTLNPMKKATFLWYYALSLKQKEDLREEEDGDGWVQIP